MTTLDFQLKITTDHQSTTNPWSLTNITQEAAKGRNLIENIKDVEDKLQKRTKFCPPYAGPALQTAPEKTKTNGYSHGAYLQRTLRKNGRIFTSAAFRHGPLARNLAIRKYNSETKTSKNQISRRAHDKITRAGMAGREGGCSIRSEIYVPISIGERPDEASGASDMTAVRPVRSASPGVVRIRRGVTKRARCVRGFSSRILLEPFKVVLSIRHAQACDVSFRVPPPNERVTFCCAPKN